MGATCSVGAMGRISSQDDSEQKIEVINNKKNRTNNDNNKGNNNKFKRVKSFGNLKKKMMMRKNSSPDHSKNLPPEHRFDSGDFRFSFSSEFKPSSTPRPSTDDKVPQKGSFLGRASFSGGLEKAVDVLDALGSGMTNLNSSGFLTGKTAKGNKISILAFEVANTITRGMNLLQSLSKENVRFMKEQLLLSQGVQCLVSDDRKVLLSLAASDKREELELVLREVIRFGNLCKDAQWHNLDRFFAKLDSENAVYRQKREHTEAKIQELMILAQNTSELYHELNAFDRFEQDYRQKIEELKSFNLPRKGEHLMTLDSELRQQKKIVDGLKRKSLWSKKLEEVIEKLVDIIAFIHQEIKEVYGTGVVEAGEKASTTVQRLGAAGLALHYANIVNQIDNIASRPTSVPPNIRDTLYHGLPASVKVALRSSLRKLDPIEELEIPQIKAEMEKILEWLAPMAGNTLKAYQGFGWVGEWANASTEFGKKTAGTGNVRLQTLYHADKEKMDWYIVQLVTLLHRLISGVRQRDSRLKALPLRSPSKRIPSLHSAMKTFPSPFDGKKTLRVELSEEDRELLERASKRKKPSGSRSQEFDRSAQRVTRSFTWSRSMESSPYREPRRTPFCSKVLEAGDLDFVSSGFEAPF